MQEMIQGYEIPLHRSLTEPILLGGVPRTIAILNGTLGAAFGIGLHTFWILPVNIIVHIAAVILTKRDPQFFDAFKRHIRQKGYYST